MYNEMAFSSHVYTVLERSAGQMSYMQCSCPCFSFDLQQDAVFVKNPQEPLKSSPATEPEQGCCSAILTFLFFCCTNKSSTRHAECPIWSSANWRLESSMEPWTISWSFQLQGWKCLEISIWIFRLESMIRTDANSERFPICSTWQNLRNHFSGFCRRTSDLRQFTP